MAFEGCRLVRSSNQSIPDSTWTPVSWDTEVRDDNAYHEGVTNPSRLTIPEDGWYLYGFSYWFDTSAAGDQREGRARLNGTTTLDMRATHDGTQGLGEAGCGAYYFSAGDYIECEVYQDTTGALNLLSAGGGTSFWIVRALDGSGALEGARVYNSAAIEIPASTLTYITFDSEETDDSDYHSTSTNTGRLTAPADGWYLIGWSGILENTGTGQRVVGIDIDRTTRLTRPSWNKSATSSDSRSFFTAAYLTAGEYVEVWIYHTNGTPVDVLATAESPYFWIARTAS